MTQRPIELILARQLAGGLGTPVVVLDAHGSIVATSEAAEPWVGRAGTRELPGLRAADGTSLPPEAHPGAVALRDRRPTLLSARWGEDGPAVEVGAWPLVTPGGEVVGAVLTIGEPGDA